MEDRMLGNFLFIYEKKLPVWHCIIKILLLYIKLNICNTLQMVIHAFG